MANNYKSDMTMHIVFIDSRVNNYQALISGLAISAEVFILDSETDGIAQMVATLQGRTGIDALPRYNAA